MVHTALDLLFPPRCSGCARVDYAWCDACQLALNQTPIIPLTRSVEPLRGIVSTGVHTGRLRAAIHGLKYDHVPLLAHVLAQRLAGCLMTMNWPIDMIVPVPLHADRLAQRGYNQCQLLGEHLALHVSLPCVPTAIRRERDTQSQVGLTAQERQVNVTDAFRAVPNHVENHSLLLIDDVCTTGATLSSCAEAALAAGAAAVYALTLTTAQSPTGDASAYISSRKERLQ